MPEVGLRRTWISARRARRSSSINVNPFPDVGPLGPDLERLHSDRRAELRLIGGSHYPEWSLPLVPIVGQDNRIEHLTSMHVIVELGKCVRRDA